MVWLNAATGVFLSAAYVTGAIRIWQRRGALWATVSAVTAVAFAYPTATYIWQALHGVTPPAGEPWGLLLFVLPAALMLRMVAWQVRDEAKASHIIEHLGDNGSPT